MPDSPTESRAQRGGHVIGLGGVARELDAPSDERVGCGEDSGRESTQVGARQLLQTAVGWQGEIEYPLADPLLVAEGVVKEVGGPQDRIGHLACGQFPLDDCLGLEVRYTVSWSAPATELKTRCGTRA